MQQAAENVCVGSQPSAGRWSYFPSQLQGDPPLPYGHTTGSKRKLKHLDRIHLSVLSTGTRNPVFNHTNKAKLL